MDYDKKKARPGGQPGIRRIVERAILLGFSKTDLADLCQSDQNESRTCEKSDTPLAQPCSRLVHFVRFSSPGDQRFQNAARVFGPPDYLHRHWDRRALREIADGDVIVFAKGDADQPFVAINGDDEAYARFAASPHGGGVELLRQRGAS